MKHPPFYVIKILQDTDLSHSRRIELAIDVLKLSKEELQQPDIEQWCFKKNYSRHYAIAIRQFIKEEILGENQHE